MVVHCITRGDSPWVTQIILRQIRHNLFIDHDFTSIFIESKTKLLIQLLLLDATCTIIRSIVPLIFHVEIQLAYRSIDVVFLTLESFRLIFTFLFCKISTFPIFTPIHMLHVHAFGRLGLCVLFFCTREFCFYIYSCGIQTPYQHFLVELENPVRLCQCFCGKKIYLTSSYTIGTSMWARPNSSSKHLIGQSWLGTRDKYRQLEIMHFWQRWDISIWLSVDPTSLCNKQFWITHDVKIFVIKYKLILNDINNEV